MSSRLYNLLRYKSSGCKKLVMYEVDGICYAGFPSAPHNRQPDWLLAG